MQSNSHKRFCTRDFACWAYILDYGESKKRCLSSCRNKSSHKIPRFSVKYQFILKERFQQVAESYSVKYDTFFDWTLIFILRPLDLSYIFYANNNRTIEYFKSLIRCISLKLIFFGLDNEIQSYSLVQEVPGSNPARGFAWELLLRPKFRQSFLDLP